MAELLMATITHKEQRKAAKLQATINPERCPLCRATVTMTTVRVCSQCGGQCCWTSGRYSYSEGTGCNATPGTGRVICKACE